MAKQRKIRHGEKDCVGFFCISLFSIRIDEIDRGLLHLRGEYFPVSQFYFFLLFLAFIGKICYDSREEKETLKDG